MRNAVPGTRSTIVIPGDQIDEVLDEAKTFVALALVGPKLLINGVEQTGGLRKGHYRRDFACGAVYTNRQTPQKMIVRVNGIPMAVHNVPYEGGVVVELTDSKCLTSNRDALRYQYRDEIAQFVQDLSTNRRRALKTPVVEVLRYDGPLMRSQGGKDEVERAPVELSQADSAALTEVDHVTSSIDDEANQLAMSFVIRNESGRKVPDKWRPDSPKFCQYARKLARLWAKVLLTVHEALGVNDEFAVGFIFNDSVVALHEYSPSTGRTYYINPVKSTGGKWRNRWRYSPGAGRDSLNEMSAAAIHEVCHGLGYPDHDEAYSTVLTKLLGMMLSHYPDLVAVYREDRNRSRQRRKQQ